MGQKTEINASGYNSMNKLGAVFTSGEVITCNSRFSFFKVISKDHAFTVYAVV